MWLFRLHERKRRWRKLQSRLRQNSTQPFPPWQPHARLSRASTSRTLQRSRLIPSRPFWLRRFAPVLPLIAQVMNAVMVLMKCEASWAEAKRQLNDPNFMSHLINYDKVTPELLGQMTTVGCDVGWHSQENRSSVQWPWVQAKCYWKGLLGDVLCFLERSKVHFTISWTAQTGINNDSVLSQGTYLLLYNCDVTQVSTAAKGLSMWVLAMQQYGHIYRQVCSQFSI